MHICGFQSLFHTVPVTQVIKEFNPILNIYILLKPEILNDF